LLPTIAGAVVGGIFPGAGTMGSSIAGGITSGLANGWNAKSVFGGLLGGGAGRNLVQRFATAGTPAAPTAPTQGGGQASAAAYAPPNTIAPGELGEIPAATPAGVAQATAATAAKGNAKPVKPTFKNVGEGIRSVLMDEKAREQFTKDNFWPIAAALGSYSMIPEKYNGPKGTPARFWKQKFHRGTKVNPLFQQQQGQPHYTDQYWEDGEYTTEDPFAKGYASGGDVVSTQEPTKTTPNFDAVNAPVAAPAQRYYSTDYKSSYHDPLMEYIDAVNARRKPVPKTSTPVNTGPATGPGTGNPNPDPRGDGSARDDNPVNTGGGTGGTPVSPISPIPVTPMDPIEVTRPPRDRDVPGYTGGGIRDAINQILPTYPIESPVEKDNSNVIVEDPETGKRTDLDLQPYGDRGLRDLINRVIPQYNVPDIVQPIIDIPTPKLDPVVDTAGSGAQIEPEPKPKPKEDRTFFDGIMDIAKIPGNIKNTLSDTAINAIFDAADSIAGDKNSVDAAGSGEQVEPETPIRNRVLNLGRFGADPAGYLLDGINNFRDLYQGNAPDPVTNPLQLPETPTTVDTSDTAKTVQDINRENRSLIRQLRNQGLGGLGGAAAAGAGLVRLGGVGRGGNTLRGGSVTSSGYQGPPPDPSVKKGKAAGGMLGYGYAGGGGIASLGGYSDGGRLLRGPGDGVSDDIPAKIHRNDGTKQEARLADGEFVFPARIVSEIGNGSTEAGAKKLYDIMNRIQRDRGRSLKDVAFDSNAERHFNSLMA
jgi:hypothetical protein